MGRVNSTREEIIEWKNALAALQEKLDEEDEGCKRRGIACLAKQLTAAKERADKAEKRVEEEKERFKRFHERTEKGAGELVRRTGEVGEFKWKDLADVVE